MADDGLIEVTGIGITVGEDGTPYPTAVLDAAHRPDVTDLARVHAVEGVGDVATSVGRLGPDLVLTVALTRPVRAAAHIRFRMPEHRPVLDDAAGAGHLLLATSEPAASGANPLWLAVDLDGPALRAVLDAW